jgi:hypothetical protein
MNRRRKFLPTLNGLEQRLVLNAAVGHASEVGASIAHSAVVASRVHSGGDHHHSAHGHHGQNSDHGKSGRHKDVVDLAVTDHKTKHHHNNTHHHTKPHHHK